MLTHLTQYVTLRFCTDENLTSALSAVTCVVVVEEKESTF